MSRADASRASARMAPTAVVFVTFATLAMPGGFARGASGGRHSELWGEAGEKWEPGGRLPDFSYAGYRMGERPIPLLPVTANVKAFGAKGDGKTDDTDAFKEAIRRTNSGAILVPPGKYVITDFLEIAKGGIVLRGAGPDKTTLFFPKYLNDIKPNWGATTGGRRTSNYSWGGGYVVLRSRVGGREVAKLAAPAKRGTRVLALDKRANVSPGDFVEIRQHDNDDNSLASCLYAGQPGDVRKLNGRTSTSHVSRVTSVRGERLTIERALLCDADPKWGASVREFRPTETDSGVEDITFEFPVKPYGGHFTELGYNPLAFRGAVHCWARNIRILNADSGPMMGGRFCTISGVVYESKRKPDGRGHVGHHGIYIQGEDQLFEKFDFRGKFIHDISVSHHSGCVSRGGRGVDVCFDHHKRAPYANLFTDIDIGEGRRMYMCGGGRLLGKNSAAWETFWCIRARTPQKPPPERFGPDMMNFVGVFSREKPTCAPAGKWWEPIPPELLAPRDLYRAQLDKRLGRTRAPKRSAARRSGRIARPAPDARPRASEGALAKWNARLRSRAEGALREGRLLGLFLASMAARVEVRSMGPGGKLKLSRSGLRTSIEWAKLNDRERASLAASLARGGERKDVSLAAFWALAAGDSRAADDFLRRLPKESADAVRGEFE
jgi:hypothetical protein